MSSDEQEKGIKNLSSYKGSIKFDIGGDPVLLRPYEYGWELCKQVSRKGEAEWTPYKWYPDITRALDAVSEFKLRNAEFTDLCSLARAAQEVRDEIRQIYSVKKGGKP